MFDTVIIDKIKAVRCPECGQPVFVPALRLPPVDPNDPEVWCREFGHWAGRLGECVINDTTNRT